MTRLAVSALVLALAAGVGSAGANPPAFQIDRVVDGDTVVLRNGAHVRLVQIDTHGSTTGST